MLTVVVTVQAYVQPYRRRLWNVLELVMSVNVMILLLIRNTDSIESALQVFFCIIMPIHDYVAICKIS